MTPDAASARRVLLVSPFPNWQWVSINRYARNVRVAIEAAGLIAAEGYSPWWNPPSVLYGLRTRYRQRSPAFAEHRANPFDVVHITDHALAHHVAWLGRSSPTVVTCHDLMPFYLPGYYRGSLAPLKMYLIRWSVERLHRADHLIAVSGATRDHLVRLLDVAPERVSVVPNIVRRGLHPVDGARETLAQSGIVLPAGPIVLSVGHNGRYKYLDATLAAISDPSLAGASLVRVGTPLKAEQRAMLARHGREGSVIELGRVSSEALRAIYSAATVLAHPSRDEGFGIPVIEAMACGLPVVTSDGGALPEVVGDAGLIVPLSEDTPDMGKRLAAALASVIEDPAAAALLRARGLAHAERYRPAAVAPQLIAAYDRATLAARERLPSPTADR